MSKNNKLLEMIDIKKSFIIGSDKLQVLTGASIEIQEKEAVALIGPSGSGKSTLLHIAALLDNADSGKIFIDGQHCSNLSRSEIDNIHQKKVGFIYQSNNLLNDFTAIENVMLPLMIQGVNKKQSKLESEKILEIMNLSNRINHYPSQLSGGQCQRIAIARAIVTKPLILLADEPTGSLDPKTGNDVFSQLLSIVKNNKLCLIIATHNPIIAKKCDRIFIMESGKSVEINSKNKNFLQKNCNTNELVKQFY